MPHFRISLNLLYRKKVHITSLYTRRCSSTLLPDRRGGDLFTPFEKLCYSEFHYQLSGRKLASSLICLFSCFRVPEATEQVDLTHTADSLMTISDSLMTISIKYPLSINYYIPESWTWTCLLTFYSWFILWSITPNSPIWFPKLDLTINFNWTDTHTYGIR